MPLTCGLWRGLTTSSSTRLLNRGAHDSIAAMSIFFICIIALNCALAQRQRERQGVKFDQYDDRACRAPHSSPNCLFFLQRRPWDSDTSM